MSENKGKIDRKFDAVVIGGGPAGMSAAMWFDELGQRVLLINNAAKLGGMMLSIFAPITNYLGCEAANGREMSERFAAQLSSAIELKLSTKVTAIDADQSRIECGGETFDYRTLVFAAGVRRRTLRAVEVFAGNGILQSGAKDKLSVKGKRVVIVGGGDAALENALILSDHASEVSVVHRRGEFTARAEFVQKAEALGNVNFLMNSEVAELSGDEKLSSVAVRNRETGEISSIDADRILVRIGTEPNSDLLRGKVRMDDNGFIIVDANCRTSIANIFAVGDVADPLSPTIATAVGMGAAAAKTAFGKFFKS